MRENSLPDYLDHIQRAAIDACDYRIAHGHFEIDLDIVWATVRVALPDLIQDLAKARGDD